ncbi:MAG TPA: class I fructose-bisphosphate aldolase [Gammaproteobacteria bacterium]|jgi:fructose-bisphosphate aldolase class I|nr:class I fructose-bisphosphate aldolase [Gammaproteobacteria bacterium]
MLLKELESTIQQLSQKGKGILAADESGGTITKRFEALGITSTEQTRQAYRDLLITTPGINEFIAGVILFEETLNQKTLDGTPFPEKLKSLGILPGIKVDKGLVILPNTSEEQITQGLDGLAERLQDYKAKGALFAKWRAVYAISDKTPSMLAIKTNAECLARYAAICQTNGIVPIVEPEVLIDGEHTLERCKEVSERVLNALFRALTLHKVKLEYIVLKPSMVINGKKCSTKASTEQVALNTINVLRRTVPAAVPTINFLSGGQTSEEATANLNAMNTLSLSRPWNVSFSYARALQEYAMKIWHGDTKNVAAAQKAFYERARLNSLASLGQYQVAMEKEKSVA